MITAWKDIAELATLDGAIKKDGRRLVPDDLGIIKNAAIVFDHDKILWQGNSIDLPQQYQQQAVSLTGHVVTPEIVDSHTHLVFAGNRADEYKMRLDGADYQAIANSGGGILATMNATKDADEDMLLQQAIERVQRIHSYGVGTIEVKSGYALTMNGEKKLSRVIHRLRKHFDGTVRILNTYMAAHAIPKNFNSSSQYLDQIVLPLFKDLAQEGIIDAVDIFHEQGYFNQQDVLRLFATAKDLNIPVKMHADEFADNGGASIAAKHKALSADHLLCTGEAGIAALANSNTVATLLPGTGYFLGKPQAQARALLDAGAKVAIASDFNPGSCHVDNVLLLASLAAPNYKMNSAELWAAITINARDALGLKAQPRFSIFKAMSLSEITYSWGRNFSINSI